MPSAQTYAMTLPGPMLTRGFWLYVWRVTTLGGELLYVGRTGDNSSPHATAPYTRMGQHLGYSKAQNSLRRLLLERSIEPESCESFELISHGPIYPEVEGHDVLDRLALMEKHVPIRNLVGAMERELAASLLAAGYSVMNKVSWRHPHDPEIWARVRREFTAHFPKLAEVCP